MLNFEASQKVVDDIFNSMIIPDKEVAQLLEEVIKEYNIQDDFIKANLKEVIKEELHRIIVSIAKSSYCKNEDPKISEGGFFTFEVCKELQERLALDPSKNIIPILTQIYNELFEFLSNSPYETVWGKVIVENNEIQMSLKDNISEWNWLKKSMYHNRK